MRQFSETTTSNFTSISPVLPSADISRDVAWYKEKVGFECAYSDKMYAILYRNEICIHLQWHANTQDDPLLGGSVIRIYVKDINPFFTEFVQRGTITHDKLRLSTPWGTNEFGFFDLNTNGVFIVEDLG